MEPNTNEATAPKRLKTGGRKPLIIIGVIVVVLAAAYVALCAYANSLDTFYPNTTINGVDVAGLTPEQAAERLRQKVPAETVEFYLPLTDETGNGESVPEEVTLYEETPAAVCTYQELGVTENLDYETSAQFAFDTTQGRSNFLAKGWEYLACLIGADGRLGVVLEPEEAVFQAKMKELSEQFSREAQDASYEVTENAIQITKARNGLSVSAAGLTESVQARWNGTGDGEAVGILVDSAQILPAKTLTAQEIYDDCSGVVKNASYDKETGAIVPEEAGADFDVDEAQRLLDAAEPGETVTVPAQVELPAVTAEELEQVLFRDVLGEARTHVGGTSARRSNVKLSAAAINEYVMNSGDVFSYNDHCGPYTLASGYQKAGTYQNGTEYTVVATALNLNRDLLRLIQKFDFTKKNPKLIFINTTEKILSLEDSILVAYLNLVGFDILFFVPTGYQCIEKYLPEGYVNEHQIGEYLYDLSVPNLNAVQEGGLSSIRRLFGRST